MARITFSQARSLLHTNVTSKGPTDPLVASSLNLVLERFLKDPARFKGSQFVLKLPSSINGVLAVPTALVESIDAIQVAPDELTPSEFVNLQSFQYLFNEGSPGYINQQSLFNGPFSHTVVELPNRTATQYDTVPPDRLTFSSSNTLATVSVVVTYLDETENIKTETLSIPPSSAITTTGTVSQITQIVKPLGTLTISMYTDPFLVIGLIATSDINPEFVRYKVLGALPENRIFYALCTKAYQPLTADTDPLPISNINALRYGMIAINYESKNDFERASVAWGEATKQLNNELSLTLQSKNPQFHLQIKAWANKIRNLI